MIILISEDLLMSSTVSGAVRAAGGTFRFVKSIERAIVKLGDEECDLLLVDLQSPSLDWDDLKEFMSVAKRAVAYAQHVEVDLLTKARQLPFESVLTRGQMHAGVASVVAGN
jgi:DNA-binding response OmpR family regulator